MSKQANKKKGKGAPRPNSNGAPMFSEEALTQLTNKLDKTLNSGDHKRKNPPSDSGAKQDQKRQRNSKGPSKDAPKGAPAGADKNVTDMDLLAEIRALGGTEDDYDLINGIDSEDEEYTKDQKLPVDKKLREELAALSKELGFANHVPEDAAADEDEVDEPEADEDEEQEAESESESEEEDADADAKKPKFGDMIFEPRADWHMSKLGKLPKAKTDQNGPFMKSIEALKQEGKQLLEQDAAKYRTSIFASSSHKFLATIMSTGTLSDKVSALTLAVQESPLHNIRAFDTLMNLASKKSRAQALGAIGALVDLLGPGTLLPSDRRLRTFQTQPGLLGTLQTTLAKNWTQGQPLPGKMQKTHLIAWAYEDWLKETYFKLIQILESWCSDEIEYSRTKALDFVYALLKEKPEQESNLLRLLVNKLGDRDRKIASRASYLLLQMQTSHPGMKPIIIRTIEQEILLHPAQDLRSKYYAINTLNQTILSSKEPASAESLMRIYFDLFITLLKTGSLGISLETNSGDAKDTEAKTTKTPVKKGPPTAKEQETEAADKLVSAVLTGVNRAAPFVGANDEVMEKHVDTLFKIAHSANFNTGIQALLLIQHLSISKNLASDRFYRTLYESLLDPRLITSSKQALYLNLLLRSLKNDLDVRRVKAFVKRMLQIAGLHQPSFVCGLLYVVAHLRETFPDLSTLINDPEESIFDDDAPEDRPVYDGKKREPTYANAHRSCLWEMIPAQAHYHPTVSLFAANLTKPAQKVAKPDLDSHSLIRFLDKFVYRNPKSTDTARGVSIMQPLRASKDLGDIWLGTRASGGAAPVNSAAFAKQAASKVAAEDVFFHEYFQHMKTEPKKPKAAAEAGGEEEDEDEIWKALVASQPDVEIDDAASDIGFDDLDEEDMASEDGDSPAMSLDSEMDDDDEDEDDEMGGVEFNDFDDDEEDGDELVAADEDEDEEEKDEKTKEKERKKARRKELKALPMFASVDDYAELLGQEEDDL